MRDLIAFAARRAGRDEQHIALQHMRDEPLPTDVPHLIALLADPALVADKPALGWLPEIESWFPSVTVAPVGDPEGVGPQHGSQVLFTVAGTYN